MLLLNFEEEPRYDYLIDELKKAFIMAINEMGEKVPANAFKQPVLDWNVSLATRFQKMQSKIEDNWQDGEADLHHRSFQYLSSLNKTLQKSRVNLLFNPAINGLNHGSFSSFNAYDS